MGQLTAITRLEAIGILRDLTTGLDPITHPFLYYLPHLLEQNIIKPTTFDSLIAFVDHARRKDRQPMLAAALTILNQVVNPDDGSLLHPSSATFYDNEYFTWKELGTLTDPKSLLFHVVNRTVMVLHLGRE